MAGPSSVSGLRLLPLTFRRVRPVTPLPLILLDALDGDRLQTLIEGINVFCRVSTRDSFLTVSLSQRKSVAGRHQFERLGVQHGQLRSVLHHFFYVCS